VNLIQPFLVICLLLISALYLTRFRSRIFDRLILLIVLTIGILFVCFPDITSRIANLVGVGRGTDLLFYVSLISVSFILMVFYAKIREMSQNMTRLIREETIRQARKGGADKNQAT
jgi:hypothetical protein